MQWLKHKIRNWLEYETEASAGHSFKAQVAEAGEVKISLATLRSALDENAKLVRTLYSAFLAFCLYVAALASSTTHEQLLRGKAPKIPFVDIELPITGIYFVAPLLVLLFHFNLLLHLHFLARAAWQFRDRLLTQVDLIKEADKEQYEDNLDILNSSPFVYMLVGLHLNPRTRMAVRLMMGLTVLVAPPILLMVVQGAFLPYHHDWLHNFHTVIVILDLIMVIAFWDLCVTDPKTIEGDRRHWWQRYKWPTLVFVVLFFSMVALTVFHSGWWAAATIVLVSIASLFDLSREYRLTLQAIFALAITATVTFGSYRPFGGIGDRMFAGVDGDAFRWTAEQELPHLRHRYLQVDNNGRWFTAGQAIARVVGHGSAFGQGEQNLSERLDGAVASSIFKQGLLPLRTIDFHGALLEIQEMSVPRQGSNGQDIGKAVVKVNKGVNLSGRDLRAANLSGASLEQAKFAFSDLSLASLRNANLQMASFASESHKDPIRDLLENLYFDVARLQGDEEDAMKWLSGSGTRLLGTDFSNADLREARMTSSVADGADFMNANLENARLDRASLHHASFYLASLKGVSLIRANVTGAIFRNADIKDALIARMSVKFTDLRFLTNKDSGHLQRDSINCIFSDRQHHLLTNSTTEPYLCASDIMLTQNAYAEFYSGLVELITDANGRACRSVSTMGVVLRRTFSNESVKILTNDVNADRREFLTTVIVNANDREEYRNTINEFDHLVQVLYDGLVAKAPVNCSALEMTRHHFHKDAEKEMRFMQKIRELAIKFLEN